MRRTRVRVRALLDRVSASLFFVPMIGILAGVLLGLAGLRLDRSLADVNEELPLGVASTVESGRAVLGTTAGATITVAGIAFSISLLVVQLTSSQYSPRIIHGIFRDRFNKRVMGLVLGTFTYCLVVLRAVRDPLDEGGEAVVPTLSVTLGVVLGIGSISAVVAFINHNAHMLDISQLLHRVARDTKRLAREERAAADAADDGTATPPGDPPSRPPDVEITVDRDGWIQQIDRHALLGLVDEGGTVLLATTVGRYALEGSPFVSLWRPVDEDADRLHARARQAIEVGPTRTLVQDVAYGVRQLVDVALRALSPGVNDPTTAQDAVFHLAGVLAVLLPPQPGARRTTDGDGRTLLAPEAPVPVELVGLAFDEIRRAARDHPAVCRYLLEALHLLDQSLPDDVEPDVRLAIVRQARLVGDEVATSDALGADRAAVLGRLAETFADPDRQTGAAHPGSRRTVVAQHAARVHRAQPDGAS